MLVAASAWAGAATLASGQTPETASRTPEQRRQLGDLAYALGQTHYLRTLCRGDDDQTWRTRMTRMVEVEAPDEALGRTLVTRFNAGYLSLRARHPSCGAGAREQAVATASTARRLSEALAGR